MRRRPSRPAASDYSLQKNCRRRGREMVMQAADGTLRIFALGFSELGLLQNQQRNSVKTLLLTYFRKLLSAARLADAANIQL